MLLFVKCILLIGLAFIFYQDFIERRVWVFLFPIVAFCGSYLFYRNSNWEYYILCIFINITIVAVVLLINYLFARFILRKKFLKETLGLGDVFFFISFSLSFPTITFINFFVFSILFTFVFHIGLKYFLTLRAKTAPLAGCMSLFLMAIYLIHWLGFYTNIYLL